MSKRSCLILLLWCSCLCFAQGSDKLPLKKILDHIAAVHEVRFSYIEEELVVYNLVPPAETLSLVAKLNYIENHTRLRFEEGAKNYYTIFNDRKMDKPLCGYLVDAATGSGIENAQVTLPGVAAVASDRNGYFELPVLSPGEITILHQGYEPRNLAAQDLYVADCPQLKMKAITQQLAEVAAERYVAQGITKSSFGKLTVRPGSFGILPGLTEPDILQTMQQIPGITSIDETISNINVRGGTHDQNLFLWNGIRMFQTGHFFGLLSAFNPLLATRITVGKNGSSAFYGESVSSYVDLSSHTKVLDSCYNVVTVDLINANFFSKVRLSRNATILAAGRRTFTDLYTSPTFKAYQDRIFSNTFNASPYTTGAEKKDFYFYDFSLQYHQKLNDHHEFIIDGIGIENTVGLIRRTAVSQNDADLSQKSMGASLNWKSQWNERQWSEAQVYYSWYSLSASNQIFPSGQNIGQQNSISNFGLRLRHNYKLSDRWELDGGYQFDQLAVEDKDDINNPAFHRRQSNTSQTYVLIAQGNYLSPDSRTKLQMGIRGNYFARYEFLRLEPRLAFTHALSDHLTLELLGELKSQTLSQIVDHQQDFLGIQNKRWELADGNMIPIQKSQQYSVGLTRNENGWLVTVDNFYKKISGITTGSQGFRNQFEFTQAVGSYEVLGTEILLQRNFTRFSAWVSYSYNDNRYQFNKLVPADFLSSTSIVHLLSCAGFYEWNRFRLAVGAKYHSGTPYTPAQGILTAGSSTSIVYGSPNSERLNHYFQVNCSASKSWNLRPAMALSASASILNILDRKNVIGLYPRINPVSGSLENVATYSLGFTPNVSLKLSF